MDMWEAILVVACLGTFLLEVAAFYKIIQLIEEIKDGLGIKKDQVFQPGDMLADGLISLVERMSEDSERGERARSAFSNMIYWGTDIMRERFMSSAGNVEEGGLDLSKMPKGVQSVMGIVQFLDNAGLLEPMKKSLADGGGKATERVLDAYGINK